MPTARTTIVAVALAALVAALITVGFLSGTSPATDAASADTTDPHAGHSHAGHGDEHSPFKQAGRNIMPSYDIVAEDPGALRAASQSVYFGRVVNNGGNVCLPDSDCALEMGRFAVQVTEVLKTKTNATADHEVKVGETIPVRRTQGVLGDNTMPTGTTALFFTSWDGARNWHFETVEPQGDQPYTDEAGKQALLAEYQAPAPFVYETDPGVASQTEVIEPESGGEVQAQSIPTEETPEPMPLYCPTDEPNCTPQTDPDASAPAAAPQEASPEPTTTP